MLLLSGDGALTVFGEALSNPINYLWLGLAGLTFGFCYVSWYKSFPLIGVGRGQAIAALYGPFAVVWLTIFTFELPEINFIIGGLVAVLGSFVMYTERREVMEAPLTCTTRATSCGCSTTRSPTRP